MKNIILLLLLLLFFQKVTTAQIPQLIWEKQIYFQSSVNNGINGLNIDKFGNFYIVGYDLTNPYNGFLAKFNNNFDTLWRKIDLNTSSYEPKAIYENKDKIIYTNINYGVTPDSTFLVCRSISSGNKLWQRSMNAYSTSRYGICKYGDSLIISSKLNSSQVNLLILNLNGDSVRTFNVNISVNQGSVTIDCRDNFVWLRCNTWSSGLVSRLSKINLKNNSIVWTKYPGNYSASANCFLDSNNNYYFTDSFQDTNSYTSYQVIKYDSSGNPIWFKKWDPRPGYKYNSVRGITESNNRVVSFGGVGRYTHQSGTSIAYLSIRNSINGDSIYSQFIFPSDTSYATFIKECMFGPDGFLYVILSVYKSYGNRYYYMRKYSLTATIIKRVSEYLPDSYVLCQNYPNPFNPSTNIKFNISKNSFVKLIVYDILGKEITTLVNEKLNLGSYSVDWNADEYPSGVYFYRIETDGFADTKRMLLLK